MEHATVAHACTSSKHKPGVHARLLKNVITNLVHADAANMEAL